LYTSIRFYQCENRNKLDDQATFIITFFCHHFTALTAKEVCAQPQSTGPCRASIPRYYYNVETKRCEEFTYGGCGGNRNNFETEILCRQYCRAEVATTTNTRTDTRTDTRTRRMSFNLLQ
jgi:hypothetical protein